MQHSSSASCRRSLDSILQPTRDALATVNATSTIATRDCPCAAVHVHLTIVVVLKPPCVDGPRHRAQRRHWRSALCLLCIPPLCALQRLLHLRRSCRDPARLRCRNVCRYSARSTLTFSAQRLSSRCGVSSMQHWYCAFGSFKWSMRGLEVGQQQCLDMTRLQADSHLPRNAALASHGPTLVFCFCAGTLPLHTNPLCCSAPRFIQAPLGTATSDILPPASFAEPP